MQSENVGTPLSIFMRLAAHLGSRVYTNILNQEGPKALKRGAQDVAELFR